MNSSNPLLFLLACAGLTFIIVHAKIMDKLKIRQFLNKFEFTRELIKCSLCTGVWTGTFLSLLYCPLSSVLLYALASSAFSFLYERFVIFLDELVTTFEKDKL